ncbi:MAG: hypothetical protein FWG21_04495, partial [Oscillospiraceae bacterium]|nr:hypothetical protein [Oscillospiraceae bacterium]
MENNYWENLSQPYTAPSDSDSPQIYREDNTYTSQIYSQPYSPYPIPSEKIRRQKSQRRFAAWMLIICIVVSFAGGYVGGLLTPSPLPEI